MCRPSFVPSQSETKIETSAIPAGTRYFGLSSSSARVFLAASSFLIRSSRFFQYCPAFCSHIASGGRGATALSLSFGNEQASLRHSNPGPSPRQQHCTVSLSRGILWREGTGERRAGVSCRQRSLLWREAGADPSAPTMDDAGSREARGEEGRSEERRRCAYSVPRIELKLGQRTAASARILHHNIQRQHGYELLRRESGAVLHQLEHVVHGCAAVHHVLRLSGLRSP